MGLWNEVTNKEEHWAHLLHLVTITPEALRGMESGATVVTVYALHEALILAHDVAEGTGPLVLKEKTHA